MMACITIPVKSQQLFKWIIISCPQQLSVSLIDVWIDLHVACQVNLLTSPSLAIDQSELLWASLLWSLELNCKLW